MKNRKITCLLIVLVMLLLTGISSYADIGPKASVNISFKNMGSEICYGTLLSEKNSTGPYSVWNGENCNFSGSDLSFWRKFVDYEDPDGFYFLQFMNNCSNGTTLKWGYRPPSTFKILLYFPESDTFVSSGIYEKYAFDTYYSVDMSGINTAENGEGVLKAEKNYNYTWESISLVCRIIITVLIEIGIAFLFGFRNKKTIYFILNSNIATQGILNILLNLINYNQGNFFFAVNYILFEIIVIVFEAVLYAAFLNKTSDKHIGKSKAIIYALTANAVSAAAGFGVAVLIPGIF